VPENKSVHSLIRGKRWGNPSRLFFKSVPEAVRRDPGLYSMLVPVDAIRLGNPHEAKLAQQLLEKGLNPNVSSGNAMIAPRSVQGHVQRGSVTLCTLLIFQEY